MSLINTDAIWLALGDFFNLFPDEERVYWTTFWEAYSDIAADLWGYAFQVDRAKSLFATTPTMERREVLVKTSNLVEGIEARFVVSRVYQDDSGRWIVRGYVPRSMRSFKAVDLPDQGTIRIGVDILPYIQVNTVTVATGAYTGFVREATFVLGEAPGHDYGDDPDLNEDFARNQQKLQFRVDHTAGLTTVDAVLINVNDDVTVNSTGRLVLGVPGVNAEVVDYESVTVVADRYVFQLATSWQAPDTGVEDLAYEHLAGETLLVETYDQERWQQLTSGRSRVVSAGDALLIIDQEPSPTAARVELQSKLQLQENTDFDVAVVVSLDTWPDPTPNDSSRHAYTRLRVGPSNYVIGVLTRRTAGGDIEVVATAGPESAPTEKSLGTSLALPYNFEARFKRVAGVMELQFRPVDDDAYQLLATETVTGARASMDLVVYDPDSEEPSQVHFDEVIRRVGGVVGNTRLEETFSARADYPYVYDIDQNVVSAGVLRDRPRLRSEYLQTIAVIEEDEGVIKAVAAENVEFESQGVPESGVLEINGVAVIYDSYTRDGSVFVFNVRGAIDPDLLPLAAETVFTASTRQLHQDVDFELSGDSGIAFRELPTRDRMWAPVAQIDIRHVQNTFGVLTDLDSDASTDTYLGRVQGTWFALMSGPSIRNVHSGLQLAMGLPVAKIDGVVTSIDTESDALGRITRQYLTILGPSGAFEHDLNPSLYPFIDWTVSVGSAVEQFQPLTNGIEVLDVISDNDWHLRFPGVADIERFNNFGVFVAVEALTAESSVEDAIRFALRIKPTYTKMIARFALTGAGSEDLSEDLDDDAFFAHAPAAFEDMSFDEGMVPDDTQQILRLGEGHKLGQGKTLGGTGLWHPQTLGTYQRQGPFVGDGSIIAGSDQFTGNGGFLEAEVSASADGSVSAGSNVFTTAGAHTFVVGDVGKIVDVPSSPDDEDNGGWVITAFISSTQVLVEHVFGTAAAGLDWVLRDAIFTSADLAKNVYIDNATDPADNGIHKILAVVSENTVQVAHTFATTESGLDWELRSYLTLGGGATLGELRAFRTPVEGQQQPQETWDAEEIINVAMTP